MLSSNRQPKLSRTSPKKCEIPGASFIRRQNPRKHRSIRMAKGGKLLSYAMPARNKNRLAPLTIKPPKLRKYAAQSREKRRLCRQKPAAAAQYPNTQPTRDHANTPRQQLKKSLRRHCPPPSASKKLAIKQQNAENASVSTEIYSAARRKAAIQIAPLPTKIRQFERIICLLQGKSGQRRQKAAMQNSDAQQ